jgi:hypothetical protein
MPRNETSKAVSTLLMILLMILSAIIGGVASFLFAIYPFIAVPQGSSLAISGVYVDPYDANSFYAAVLNPSYSSSDINVTGITIRLNQTSDLYELTESDPSIGEGLTIPVSSTVNISCSQFRAGGTNYAWGDLVAEYAGDPMTVIVLGSEGSASDRQTTLPYVSLNVAETQFDPSVSLREFNLTVTSDPESVVNVTVNDIEVQGIEITPEKITPQLPQLISAGDSTQFSFTNASWYTLVNTSIVITTDEGYRFSQALSLPRLVVFIQNITFDADYTDYFNVSISNYAESSTYVNLTQITITMINQTTLSQNYDPSQGIQPNTTKTVKFDWQWREYRGDINLLAGFLQDFEISQTNAKRTPVVLLNASSTFNLSDRTHINITVQSHPSTIEPINVTSFYVNETSTLIGGTLSTPNLPYGLIDPGQNETFGLTYNWASFAGRNLTLIVSVLTNESLEAFSSPFTLQPPAADLTIIGINSTIADMLDITLVSSNYSLVNLTISKITYTFQNQTEISEDAFPPTNYIVITPGDFVTVHSQFNWQPYGGQTIIIAVTTQEGVTATLQTLL